MDNRYTGVFEQIGDWWIGHVEELPGCNVQERTLEEARASLKGRRRLGKILRDAAEETDHDPAGCGDHPVFQGCCGEHRYPEAGPDDAGRSSQKGRDDDSWMLHH